MSLAEATELHGYAALTARAELTAATLPLGEVGDREVLIEVEACGVCHSDIHLIDDDWGMPDYPLVPGHEILGRVVRAGRAVPASHAVGTFVGVGWQRGACGRCDACVSGRDNLCAESLRTCVHWHGGYADVHLTNWNFAFPMPEGLRRPEAAPLLCAGITVYSPLCEFVRGPGARVGIVGIGGLGHLAVRMAAAMGYEVTVFSSTPAKEAEARRLGAHFFVNSSDPDNIGQQAHGRLDLVLVTANVDLPWGEYLDTLRADGTLCFVGVPPAPVTFELGQLLGLRRRIAASPIGSSQTMRQMLEFCARHQILAQAEIFPMAEVNRAVAKVRKNDVRYRAVLVR
jgi:uncharacterized zinc-type alcohol dehydrogenase-like protein